MPRFLLVKAFPPTLGNRPHSDRVVDGALRIPLVLGVRAVRALLPAELADGLVVLPFRDVLLLRLLGERVEVLAGG